MPKVNVVRPDGSSASVDESALPALERLGYRREQAPEAESRAAADLTEAYYDTPGQKAKALGEGVASGLTLGAADLLLDDIATRERETHLPGWTATGEVFGAVAPALLSGGSSTAASLARATPAAKAALLGERVAAKVGGGAIARGATAAAVEGGVSAAGMTAGKVLTDQRPDTIESFTTEVGLGTLFGLGAGAALGGSVAGLGQVGQKALDKVKGRLAQAAEAPGWKGAPVDSAKANLAIGLDDAEKGIARDLSLARSEAELATARLDAEYNLGELPDLPEPPSRAGRAAESVGTGEGTAVGKKAAGKVAQAGDAVDVPPPIDRSGTVADDILEPTTALEVPVGAPGPRGRTVADAPPARGERPLRGAATRVDEFAPTQLDAPPTLSQNVDNAAAGGGETAATRVPLDDNGLPMSQHEQAILKLEGEHNKVVERLAKLEFKAKRLGKIRGDIADPEAFARIGPDRLVEVLEELRDISPTAHSAVRQSYEKFLEEAGAPSSLGGLQPQDIAKMAGVKPQLWSTLTERDVPLLAAWAHMRAPKAAAKSIPAPAPKTKGKGEDGKESPGVRLAGKAFRYLGGRAAKKAVGGGFGVYMLGWNAADALWGGKLGGMISGARANVAARVDKSLAKLAGLQKASAPSAALGVAASRLTPKEYEESAREVHAMAGAQGREALYMATANLRAVDPDLADKVIEDGMRRVKYLSGVLPKPPPQGVFPNPRWAPSPVDMAKTAQLVQVCEDPASAVELMGEGRLTPQAANCFRETSPALFRKVAQSLLSFAQANPDASPVVKRQVAMMLGVPADTLQLYTAQLQSHFGANAPEPGPAQTAKTPPAQPTQPQAITER